MKLVFNLNLVSYTPIDLQPNTYRNIHDNSHFKGANSWISNVLARLECTGARRAAMSHGGS